MHRFRIRAGFAALAVVLVATGCKWNGFGDPAIQSTTRAARNWLVTQQQANGGFEVAGFNGFETPDAILAIAEDAQQQVAWNTGQALAAVSAVKKGGKSALDWADDFADGTDRRGRRRQAHRARGTAARSEREDVQPAGRRDAAQPDLDRRRRRAAERLLRRVQRHALRRAGALDRDRHRAGEHARVHPGGSAGVGRLGLRQRHRERPGRHRHHEPRDPGARGGEGRARPTPTSCRRCSSSRPSSRRPARGSPSAPTTRTAPRPRSWRSPPSARTRRCRAGATVRSRHSRGTRTRRRSRGCAARPASDGHITSQNDAFPPIEHVRHHPERRGAPTGLAPGDRARLLKTCP